MKTYSQAPVIYSRYLAGIGWLVSLLILNAAQTANASDLDYMTPEQVYQLALEARTSRNYPEMLFLLRQAGEGNNLAAQELLGSVLLIGPAMYGENVQANPCEAASWIRRAMLIGSDVAMHQSLVLNGFRDLKKGRDSCSDTNG